MTIHLDALESANVSRTKITELRAMLATKFPEQKARSNGGISVPLGSKGVSEMELQRGLVTEISGSLGSSSLFVQRLLLSVGYNGGMMALVDGASAFDPAQCEAASFRWFASASGIAEAETGRGEFEHHAFHEGGAAMLRRLLWVLCKDAMGAIKVADLLLRDGNLPLVVLDLQMNSERDLRRIPSATWYRFQRILEQSSMVFVVMTPHPMVSSAAERFSFNQHWSLTAMRTRRDDLQLIWQQTRRRMEAGESTEVALRIA
jgi:hypothetical protein